MGERERKNRHRLSVPSFSVSFCLFVENKIFLKKEFFPFFVGARRRRVFCLRKAAECQTRTGRKEEGRRIGKTSFWGDRAACSSLFPPLPKLLFGFFSLPLCARKLFFVYALPNRGKKAVKSSFSSSPFSSFRCTPAAPKPQKG